jgi:hypothetical protein
VLDTALKVPALPARATSQRKGLALQLLLARRAVVAARRAAGGAWSRGPAEELAAVTGAGFSAVLSAGW